MIRSRRMDPASEALPDDVAALKAALIAERARRLEVAAELAVARAKASEDMALIAAQKLRIAKLERQVYGQRSERSARLIDQLAPDLVFLDVCLPELSGLEVIQRIRHRPDIVFTTAYDRFALAAFEVGALDYLLKPFGRQRFQTMLARVRHRLSQGTIPASERALVAFGSPLRRLFARTRDEIVPIPVQAVWHLQASGDYVEVHSEKGRHLLHVGLGELAGKEGG